MRIRPFLTVLLAAVLILPATAQAQPRKTDGLDEKGEALSEQYYLTLPLSIGMTLLQNSDIGGRNFILRLSALNAEQRCERLSPLVTKVTHDGQYIDIKVDHYRVDGRSSPRNPAHCRQDAQVPATDIVLDRDQIEADGTKYMRLHYQSFVDTYEIEIGENFIRLDKPAIKRPSTATANVYQPYRAYGVDTPAELWFLPADTVVLYAPGLPARRDARADIEALAAQQGLRPLAETLPDFKPLRASAVQEYYFTDPQGAYTDKTSQGPALFGTMAVEKKVYGLHGDEVATTEFEVYMKKLGLHE